MQSVVVFSYELHWEFWGNKKKFTPYHFIYLICAKKLNGKPKSNQKMPALSSIWLYSLYNKGKLERYLKTRASCLKLHLASGRIREYEFFFLKMEFSSNSLLFLYVSKSSFSTINMYLHIFFSGLCHFFMFVDSVILEKWNTL